MGIVGVCLIVLLGLTLARDDSGAPADFGADPARAVEQAASAPPAGDGPSPAPAAADQTRPPAVPAPSSVRIPRLRLRAPIDPVGVAPDGQVVVPEDPDRVGWYRFSPSPGAGAGSSVIVGHVDATGRGLGVLAALSEVREGDQVAVDRQDGSTVAYRITSRRTVAKNALGESGAFRREGLPTLTLITCAAPYLRDNGGYQNNLVVTAVAVPR
ncbi:class F sortase [Streptomyces omiyaensis]|uniref:class F sortase n=1 Tax=Streptomyces omiyaensis TaxID=68247 RepID=UPI001673A8FE|nr:class F sortase [Streptomyces omiyaensis]